MEAALLIKGVSFYIEDAKSSVARDDIGAKIKQHGGFYMHSGGVKYGIDVKYIPLNPNTRAFIDALITVYRPRMTKFIPVDMLKIFLPVTGQMNNEHHDLESAINCFEQKLTKQINAEIFPLPPPPPWKSKA